MRGNFQPQKSTILSVKFAVIVTRLCKKKSSLIPDHTYHSKINITPMGCHLPAPAPFPSITFICWWFSLHFPLPHPFSLGITFFSQSSFTDPTPCNSGFGLFCSPRVQQFIISSEGSLSSLRVQTRLNAELTGGFPMHHKHPEWVTMLPLTSSAHPFLSVLAAGWQCLFLKATPLAHPVSKEKN